MTPELHFLLLGEYQLAGNAGVRQFITGLAGPTDAVTEDS